nr:epidermal patterning factor-like protein 3 [Ipomoea batatas]GMD11966.1 epidermal patterning factor-like protein 3 [Ipomoea batatas]GMD86271.1 epidermal patterning factor-like protein 3 [Ipomoea batatas]
MKIRRYCCFLAATVHVLSLVCAAKRPFLAPHKTQILDSPRAVFDPIQGGEMMEGGLSKLGSRPPNCEHRCGRCKPCVAIQVPTTSSRGHMGVQYANYEPEGWKCKCGTAVFEP